jgi:hypothetical protein
MRRARSRICGLAFALAAALSGCASPPSQFYTLAATARPEAGASPAAYAVAVDSVGLPATVDRPQFVVQKGRIESPSTNSIAGRRRWRPTSRARSPRISSSFSARRRWSADRWRRVSSRRTGSRSISSASSRCPARPRRSTLSGRYAGWGGRGRRRNHWADDAARAGAGGGLRCTRRRAQPGDRGHEPRYRRGHPRRGGTMT